MKKHTKLIPLLLAVLLMAGCSIFHEVPASVQEAAALSVELSKANQHNLQVVNDQYFKAWYKYMVDHLASNDDKAALSKIWQDVRKSVDPGAQFAIDLNAAILRYLREPSADLSKIVDLVKYIKSRKVQ